MINLTDYPTTGVSHTPIVLTMDDILQGYQDQFLFKMLLFSLMYAFLTLLLWWHKDKMQFEEKNKRYFDMFIYLNLVPSIYFPITMIGVYTGWY